MNTRVNKKVLIISLIFGIATFMLTIFYLSGVSREQKYKDTLMKIIVAKVAIPQRTIINNEMLELKEIPRQFIVQGALTDINQVIGKATATSLAQGEQLIMSKLNTRGRQLGLSFIIPDNMRAVSVEVDSSASIAGLINPGDKVDVLCTLTDKYEKTVTLLQDISVLAIDRNMENSAAAGGKISRSVIATFALDGYQAEKLVMAANKGRLKLLLRPVNDKSVFKSYGASVYQLLPNTGGNKSSVHNIKIIKGTQTTNKKL